MSDISDPFGGYKFQSYRVFSAEQHRQLAVECGICDFESHNKLVDTMQQVSEMYPMQRQCEEAFGNLSVHRDRLERIAAAASSLRHLLAEEPLAPEILGDLPIADMFADRSQPGRQLQRLLLFAMDGLATSAGTLSSDLGYLRQCRLDPENNAKSVERREIWEPVFKLWRDLGKNLGFSNDGPVMRVLQIMHAALELDPPNSHSVRQAMREFKAGGVSCMAK